MMENRKVDAVKEVNHIRTTVPFLQTQNKAPILWQSMTARSFLPLRKEERKFAWWCTSGTGRLGVHQRVG